MAGNLSVPALLGAFLLCNLANLPGIIEGEGAATASGASADSRVIDTHIHIYDPARPAGIPWPPPDSELYRRCMPADFAAVAGPAGVTAAVIIEASTLVEDISGCWI